MILNGFRWHSVFVPFSTVHMTLSIQMSLHRLWPVKSLVGSQDWKEIILPTLSWSLCSSLAHGLKTCTWVPFIYFYQIFRIKKKKRKQDRGTCWVKEDKQARIMKDPQSFMIGSWGPFLETNGKSWKRSFEMSKSNKPGLEYSFAYTQFRQLYNGHNKLPH